jgi:hypothetical protein
MKTFRHWCHALACSVMGCAGADQRPVDELANPDVLGPKESALSASFTNTYQFGTQTNAAKFQCDRFSLGQTCTIPGRVAFATWCIDSGSEFTDAQRNVIRGVLLEFFEVLSNVDWWPSGILEVAPDPDGVCRNLTDFRVSRGTVNGTLSNNIDGYSDVIYGTLVDLSEGVAGEDPAGNYQDHTGCFMTIDIVDIVNKGASSDEDRNILRHAAGHAMLACTGFGTQSGDPSPFFARRALMPDESGLPLTSGQQCIASTYDFTDNGDFSLTFSNCATD